MVLLLLSACQTSSADFTITLGGDVMLAREGFPIFHLQGQQIDPWRELSEDGILFANDHNPPDFFLVNLESPLGNLEDNDGAYNLCAPASETRLLKLAGIDLVSLANNHHADCTNAGVPETEPLFQPMGISAVGPDLDPAWLETREGRVAVIAAQDVTGKLEERQLVQAIMRTRDNCDILIVSMHWGNEYQAGPDSRQQRLAKMLADAGADVIWGHHPHVLQKMEWLPAVDGRQVLVVYSLGNLLSDQWMLEDTRQTALLRLSFSQMRLIKIEVIPLILDRSDKTLRLQSGSGDQKATLLPDGTGLAPVKIELVQ